MDKARTMIMMCSQYNQRNRVSRAQGMCVQSSLEMLESQVMPGLIEFRDW